ncbi:MAG: ABC transporter ATP-binding protein [Clostridia bacterium]|nr:ABC transporter ATP-binding protein [Clostridia bacterium]
MKKQFINEKSPAKHVIARLLQETLPIWWVLALCAIVDVVSIVTSLYGPRLLSDLINAIYNKGVFNLPIDNVQFTNQLILLLVVYLIAGGCSIATMYIQCTATTKFFTYRHRVGISAKLTKLPVSFVDKTPHGEIISRMINDVSSMSNTVYSILEMLIAGVIKLIGLVIVLYSSNAILATAIVVLVPFSMAFSTMLANKSEKLFSKYRKINGKLYSFIEEDYTGFATVKAFNLEDRQSQKQGKIVQEHRQTGRKAFFTNGLIQPVITLCNNVSYVAVCLIGCLIIANQSGGVQGQLGPGDLVAFLMYAKMFAGPLESIAWCMGSMQHTITAARRVYDVMDKEEMKETVTLELPEKLLGNVKFENVTFSYSDKPLIENLNFEVKAGQKVAIVGPTGGGKTTLVNLLMRFYEVKSGTIYIDGVDISQISRKELRNCFAMVLQDTWLFNGTIKENIAYGKQNATEQEIERAAQKAHLDFFVDTLPDGYQTVINEESTNVSSGQKQLLTIARAYLADRKMLILDEATSNVDTRTELLIQETMDQLMQDKTSFVIAHRLSTIVNADVILVVNNGQIVETGTHKDLLEKGGFYANLYNSQYVDL